MHIMRYGVLFSTIFLVVPTVIANSDVSTLCQCRENCPFGGPYSSNLTANEIKIASRNGDELALNLLYKAMQHSGNEANVFLSPISIDVALAMVMAGAFGKTRAEIKTAIMPDFPDDRMFVAYHYLGTVLNGPKNFTLSSANAIFIDKQFSLKPRFEDIIFNSLKAQLFYEDFKNKPEEARANANQWVEQKTNATIKNIISNPIPPSTKLILANAIYFKAQWKRSFLPTDIYDSFTLVSGKQIQAQMMLVSAMAQYHSDKHFQHIGIPFKNDEVLFIVSLPKKTNGILELEKTMNVDKFLGLLDMPKKYMRIMMPKLEITKELPMKDILNSLGVNLMFDARNANLHGMGHSPGPGNLYVSDVYHKAYLKVNEHGVEASAATTLGMSNRHPRHVYKVNHPYMVTIVYRKIRAILYIGTVMNPTI